MRRVYKYKKNPYFMTLVTCIKCNKLKTLHSKGICTTCYKKMHWHPRKIICKKCGNEKIHHSKGYCSPCYSMLFHYDLIKKHNYKKYHNIDMETYRKLTQACIVCGFDKIVELHHLDKNRNNNSEKNLIALCPNHHRMIHNFVFRDEILKILTEKLR